MVLVLTQTHWSIIFITAFRSRLQAELGDATSSEERYWFIWCNPTSLQGNWYQVLFLIYFISNCNNLARFVTYVKNFLIINRWSLWTTIITWFVFYWLLSLKDLGNNCTDFCIFSIFAQIWFKYFGPTFMVRSNFWQGNVASRHHWDDVLGTFEKGIEPTPSRTSHDWREVKEGAPATAQKIQSQYTVIFCHGSSLYWSNDSGINFHNMYKK